jgi:SPX domain protein involved in polyphosphate accumulation
MNIDRMQRQRFENKYLVTEEKAQRIRDFVQSYLELDPSGVGRPEGSYAVHSLYLDSDALDTYWWTINGDRTRFKLRLRFYDNRPDQPVFFEVKSRVDRVIFKRRAAMRKEHAGAILAGKRPAPSWFARPDPKAPASLDSFLALARRIGARPKVQIGYLREAYVDPHNDAVRVTFDRRVGASIAPWPRFSTAMDRPVFPFGRTVIFEIKFTNRFPNWFRELVETFDLVQSGAAKYCMGVAMIGEERLGHRLTRFASEGLDPETLLCPMGQALDMPVRRAVA